MMHATHGLAPPANEPCAPIAREIANAAQSAVQRLNVRLTPEAWAQRQAIPRNADGLISYSRGEEGEFRYAVARAQPMRATS
jgi:hypothetical protein